MKPPAKLFDCIIIGGGPAGLLAATYLARFRRSVLLIDAGESRARRIPIIQNCPGFPDGISGLDLLRRLRDQVGRYEIELFEGIADSIERMDQSFRVSCGSTEFLANTILFATGVVDVEPNIPDIEASIRSKALCLCPVCDGYEASDLKIGVIGSDEHALREAIFLRSYSSDVSLIAKEGNPVEVALEKEAHRNGIRIAVALSFESSFEGLVAINPEGREPFDVIYPALGCKVRSHLAGSLGIERDDLGHILVGKRQETNVEGVYAAGDVVHSLNQIAVAFGQAATAATAIHNNLPNRLRCKGGPISQH